MELDSRPIAAGDDVTVIHASPAAMQWLDHTGTVIETHQPDENTEPYAVVNIDGTLATIDVWQLERR